ncbi:glycoside hydrolase family 43 protein [Paenibacillus sp. FJAT-27812]|uniref:glycoside hydrolase family 43 protein n=1 Tax=Paenibacillus sp. FJAT-27812 TaxID=1684143 RepID=UPI000ADF4105|nr:glycoside hydrolase family 43 protein [Paenibacillus sp. FJAT-27812]
MRKQTIVLLTACLMTFMSACSGSSAGSVSSPSPTESAAPASTAVASSSANSEAVTTNEPAFADASVHDPSIIKVGDTFYIFGSHLAAAKSKDLMSWEQLNSSVYEGNPIIPDVLTEMKEELAWAETDTFWAGDVIQLPDGKFYMYYSMCKGDSPRSVLGYAVADKVEGPYHNKGTILKSGMWNDLSEDGTIYDAAVHPNVVDPNVFYDKDGVLWMVYGSYSGGIFIMKMNPETGLPYPDQGYGKRLLGNNHSRIEAPYMMHSKETDYYYLFLSYGGLDSSGGYNIRVARSKKPDGPFLDSEGKDMIDAFGAYGTLFDDASIAPYGVKLMGNFQMDNIEGEVANIGTGYASPGHNSTYVDPDTGKMFLIFHTRFPSRGEGHEVRVHQMLMNTEGWPVIAPHRYSGETVESVTAGQIAGDYKYVNHGKDITAEVKQATLITLGKDGTISGGASGTWISTGAATIALTIDGVLYNGALLREWNEGTLSHVMTFSALSKEGVAIWGSHVSKE